MLGPVWLALLLDSAETVLQLTPDNSALARLDVKVGVAALYAPEQAPAVISRTNREACAFDPGSRQTPASAPELEVGAFAASIGINEDPLTGRGPGGAFIRLGSKPAECVLIPCLALYKCKLANVKSESDIVADAQFFMTAAG